MFLRFFLLLCFASLSSNLYANQVNLVPKGSWGDLHYGAMVSNGQNLYVASDGVLVLDMSNPEAPVKKTKITIPIVDKIRTIKKLKLINNNLYVMTGKQFFIFDISNVVNASLKATIDYVGANYWSDFVIKENQLFIVGQDSITLSIYDISDDTAPVLQRSVPQKINHNSNGTKLAFTNKMLVISYLGEVKLLSLAADNFLFELYSDSQDSFVRSEIPVLGDVVYFSSDNLLIIYDFSNIEKVTRSTIELIDSTRKTMVIKDSTLYVKGTQIEVFDLSTPQTPTLIKTYPQSHYIYSYMVFVEDNLVLSTNENIIALNGSSEIGKYSKSVYVNDLSWEKNFLASASQESIRLFNLETNELEEVYESESAYHNSVLLNNNYMYTDSNLVYDLQDIKNVNLVGSFFHDSGGLIGQLTVNNGNLISRSTSKVTKFQLSSAIAPIELNEIDISTLTDGITSISNDMVIKDGHCFVATEKGLYHFFQGDNSNFQIVGKLGEDNYFTETIIVEDYLYALGSGVTIWNISDLDNPTLARELYTLAINITGMSAYKNWLFLPSSNRGVAVVDITNPEQASVIDYLHKDSIYYPHDGVIENNQLVVADWGQLKRFDVNEAPKIITKSLITNEDELLKVPLDIINLELDSLTFEVVQESENGTVSLNNDGEISYLPNVNFNGSDTFTLKVVDQYGGDDEETLEVTITAINDVPTIAENHFTLEEDTLSSTTITATDIDSETLEFLVTSEPSSGTLIINEFGSFDYQPNENFNGSDTFFFTVSDGVAAPVAGNVTFEVTPVNDSPSLAVENLTLDEDTFVEGQATAIDIDSDPLTYSISVDANEGEVSINASGVYTYTPVENYNGNDTFTVTISDGFLSTSKIVEVVVTAINDVPVANELTTTGISGNVISGRVSANDIDSDELTFSIVNDVTSGSLTLNENGRFSYTSNSGFVGTDNFTFSVSDKDGLSSEANVKLNVTDKPVVKEDNGGSGGAFGLALVYLLLIAYRRTLFNSNNRG